MKKFKIKIDSKKVSDIKKKIESYNWDNMPDVKGWDLGCNKKILKNLCSYWLKKYNLGICADWLSGPKVEDAWLSANDLYKKVKKNPLIKRGF